MRMYIDLKDNILYLPGHRHVTPIAILVLTPALANTHIALAPARVREDKIVSTINDAAVLQSELLIFIK